METLKNLQYLWYQAHWYKFKQIIFPVNIFIFFNTRQVNLIPSSRPQDVYSEVANLVEKARNRDALSGVTIAQQLEGEFVYCIDTPGLPYLLENMESMKNKLFEI